MLLVRIYEVFPLICPPCRCPLSENTPITHREIRLTTPLGGPISNVFGRIGSRRGSYGAFVGT
jgi:hypothetical protein